MIVFFNVWSGSGCVRVCVGRGRSSTYGRPPRSVSVECVRTYIFRQNLNDFSPPMAGYPFRLPVRANVQVSSMCLGDPHVQRDPQNHLLWYCFKMWNRVWEPLIHGECAAPHHGSTFWSSGSRRSTFAKFHWTFFHETFATII